MALVNTRVINPSNKASPALFNGLSNRGLVSLQGKIHLPQVCRSKRALIVHCSNELNASFAEDSIQPQAKPSIVLSRNSFPPGFTFGASSSAFQVEGAVNEGGRGPSIWDTFCHDYSDMIADKSNADVATDSYHRYKEDVKLLKDMGMDAYRFSISWSRILPKGSLDGGINKEGIKYYNNLIDELLKNGIQPFVTLFHWDLPKGLHDKYGGFLDKKIIKDFMDYAEICFQEFGDRVKHWMTVNEPTTFTNIGYGYGRHAPGRCSQGLGCPVQTGNSLIEPYTVAHNIILSHANVVKLYKEKFQSKQGGEIGITLVSMWFRPYDHLHHSSQAQERSLDFMLGWYMDPLVYGDYPFNMRALVKDRLPYFTDEESQMVIGSYDFIGLNYYTSRYARSHPILPTYYPYANMLDSYADELEENKDGIPIGTDSGGGIYVHPEGLKDLLVHIKRRYNDPPIYVTENGIAELNDPTKPAQEAIKDQHRQNFLTLHLAETRNAISAGAKVKGHFTWSLTDSFEWQDGYTKRFGLCYIDYKNNLKRIPKESTQWYTKFLNPSKLSRVKASKSN